MSECAKQLEHGMNSDVAMPVFFHTPRLLGHLTVLTTKHLKKAHDGTAFPF